MPRPELGGGPSVPFGQSRAVEFKPLSGVQTVAIDGQVVACLLTSTCAAIASVSNPCSVCRAGASAYLTARSAVDRLGEAGFARVPLELARQQSIQGVEDGAAVLRWAARRSSAGWSALDHIGPQLADLGATAPRIEHGQQCVVGDDLGCAQDPHQQAFVERLK